MTGTHSYTQPDVYTIVLTITDDSGNTGTSVYQFVVVFDPDEGFVTGGGWIESPLGAYRANTSLTGPANYGFVSKYKRGAMMPTGQTQFRFKMGDLNFHSTSYDWLVLNRHSGRAQFKGQGEINGEDGFHFMIWAQDGGLNGNETDTFRIKLWLENADGSETVVYDNGLDRAIAGGSIVIHSGRE